MGNSFPQTDRMKKTSRQLLAHNLQELLRLSPQSDNELGRKAKLSHSSIGRMKKMTSAATVDALDKLAGALGIEPWMLLTDIETARLAQMAKTLWGPAKSDLEVEQHLPIAPKTAPSKGVRPSPKKSGGRSDEAR